MVLFFYDAGAGHAGREHSDVDLPPGGSSGTLDH